MPHKTVVNTLWSRFQGLDDLQVIRKKVTLIPVSDRDITAVPEHLVKRYVGQLLSSLYIPTSQDLALLRKFVHTARAHCEHTYRNDHEYYERLYTHFDDFEATGNVPDLPTAICLTGLAGVGKSSILRAMQRLLPGPAEVDLEAGHGPLTSHSHWHAQVHGRTTTAQILEPFIREKCNSTDTKPRKIHQLSKKIAYTSGVSIFLLDELQFLTQSVSANTAVTKFLLQLSHLGIPLVYAANYSLCRLLQRRHEQERQRLLASPVVLTPSTPDSDDWINYLRHVQSLLGTSMPVDLHQERHTLHHLTGGLKRLVVQLMKLSYDLAWQASQRQVTLQNIRAAYDHTEYAVSRQQVTSMLSPHTSKSAEYECPFPLPKIAAQELIYAQARAFTQKVVTSVQHDALSANERKALKAAAPTTPKAVQKPRRGKLTVEELQRSYAKRLNSQNPH